MENLLITADIVFIYDFYDGNDFYRSVLIGGSHRITNFCSVRENFFIHGLLIIGHPRPGKNIEIVANLVLFWP